MLNRIRGFILIINTLIPLILITAIGFGGWYVYQKLAEPVRKMSDTLTSLNANARFTIDQSGRAFERLAEPLREVRTKVSFAADYIAEMPVKMPDLSIPNLSLNIRPEIERLDEYPWFYLEMKPVEVGMPSINGPEIPGLTETKTTFSSMLGIMDSMVGIVDIIAGLNQLETDLLRLAVDTGQVLAAIGDIFGKFWTILKWFILFALIWLVFGYAYWTVRRLNEGVKLLFNLE